jgi:uncharacterized protein (TIGR03437 family)
MAAVLVTGLAVVNAQSRYIATLSAVNPSAPTLTLLTADLQPVGSVTGVPAGAKQVLISDQGDKLIVISENSQSPVSFIGVTGGGLSQVRTTALGSGTPVQGILSADGSLLYVVTRNPSLVYTVQVANEQVVNAALAVPGDAAEAELTVDGQYLLVLSMPNFLTPIRLSDWTAQAVVTIDGSFPNNNFSLSVAPFGRVFVTGPNVLIEFSALPPFNELARTSLAGGNLSHPGKLRFMPPAGVRAYTTNKVQSGHSIGVFDFTMRGPTTPAGTYMAGGVAIATTGNPFGNTPELVEPLFMIRELRAVGYAPAIQQVFDFNYVVGGGVSVNDFRVNQVPLTGIESIAVSNEFPNALYLYYVTSGGVLSRFPLSGIGSTPSRNVAPGKLVWLSPPSAGTPGNLYGYGGGQTGLAASSTLRYYVRAIDNTGQPLKGRTVNFQAVTSGAQVVQSSAVTNREGWAFVDVVAPSTAGDFTVQATLGNLPPVVFTSTVAAQQGGGGGGDTGGPTNQPRLIKVSGDGQLTLYSGTSFPLVVKAVDADGNPIAGKQILWQTTTTNLNFVSNPRVETDSNGMAEVRFFFLGAIPLGEAFVQGTVEAVTDIGTVTFFITQYPADQFGAPSVQLLTPEPSNKSVEVKLGQPKAGAIRFQILSGGGPGRPLGVPIPKVGLRVSSENQDPANGPVASCAEGVALSDSDGIATCTLLAKGKPGVTLLTANVGEERDFGGILLTVVPGDPVPPVIVSGDKQSAKTGATLPNRLVARIVDAGGNPLPGTQVVWSVSNPSALTLIDTISTANSNGEVSTGVRLGNLAGTFQVTVKAGDLQATFTVTAESTATQLRKISGDGQPSAPINTPFAQPLVVELLNAQNAPVAGVQVNWTVTGPATLSASSTPTGADGRAQVTVTAGSTAGAITVTASVGSLTPVTFSLQSRLPGPGITASSFRNYATGQTGVAPGNLVLLTGAGIAKNVTSLAVANIFAGRLPQQFRGLVVEFRSGGTSQYAPIYWIVKDGSLEQALIQVPYEITGTAVDVNVTIDGASTLVTGVPVAPLSPGMIEDEIDGRRAAIVIRSDGLVVTKATPARRGETVRMYAIGLGQTDPLAETNRVGRPGQKVKATVAVGIDNAGVEVEEVKLAENLIGIYEVLFKIPADAQLGDRPLGLVAAPQNGQAYYGQPSVIAIGPAQQ